MQKKLPFQGLIDRVKKKLDEQTRILFKNVKWVFIANSYGFLLSFLRSVVLARGLGLEIFGVYTLVTNFSVTFIEVFNLSMSAAIIKFGAVFKAENRKDKLVALLKKATRVTLIAYGLALISMAVLLKYFYDTFFNYPGLEWYTIFYSASHTVYLLALILSTSLLRLFFKFKVNSIVSMIMDTVEFLLILAALYFYPDNIRVFFAAVILSKLFNGIVCACAAMWEIKTDLSEHLYAGESLLKNENKKLWGFIIPNSIGGTLKTFINKGDILLLGILGTPAMIAFYSIAKKLAFSILAVTDPMMSAIYPQLSKLVAEKKYNEIITMLIRTTKLFLYPAVAFLGVVFFFREKIIVLVFGAEYAPAALPFFYLMIVALLIAVFFWNLSIMQSLVGVIHYQLSVYVCAFICEAAAIYLLVPIFEATGAAMGLLVAYLIITTGFVGISFSRLYKLRAGLIK